MTFLSVCTLAAQILGFGGAAHLGILSRKPGWYVLASGIGLIIAGRLFLTAEAMATVAALHSILMLGGITLLFRSYRDDMDDLKALADAVPTLAWMAKPDGELSYVNAKFCAYTGKSLHDVRNYRLNELIHPDDRCTVVNAWDCSVRHVQHFECEMRLRGIDGQYKWFLGRAVPLVQNGRVARWYGVSVDIHDAKLGYEGLRSVTT